MCWTMAHPSVRPSFLLTKRRNRLSTPRSGAQGRRHLGSPQHQAPETQPQRPSGSRLQEACFPQRGPARLPFPAGII